MSGKCEAAARRISAELLALARFAIVGFIATGVHIGTAWVLIGQMQLPPLLANLLAFSVAFGLSFLGHYVWVFRSRRDWRSALGRFFLVAACGLLLNNVVLVWILRSRLLSPELSVAVSAFVIPVLTYVLNRAWTFASRTAVEGSTKSIRR